MDFWIIKLDSEGDIEWQKTYGGTYSFDEANSIQQTSNGGYIVAGETWSWGAIVEILVLKLLPNGDINPRCAFIRSSNAKVSDTDITPEDTDITPEDTNITLEDTNISPQDSNANVYELCESAISTLTLSSTYGGTTDPAPGTYTYDTGTEVTLKAEPNPNSEYVFSGWSGNVEISYNAVTITMDGNKSIKARFRIPSEGEWGDGGGGGGSGGGCFIATAAFDSPSHPHLDILRDFRDTYLMPNKLGRTLVNIYYKYSPFVANFIAKHKALRIAVRINLLPFVAFSYSMVHFGPIITAVILVFIFMFPLFFIAFWRKRIIKRLKNYDS
jgi:hypothetical protein